MAGGLLLWFYVHFPKISDVEYLFMSLWAICISSLYTCLFQVLCAFLIELFSIVELSVSFLDINLLSDE